MQNLEKFNTFGVKSFAEKFYEIKNLQDLQVLDDVGDFFVLGGGSNILFLKQLYQQKIFLLNRLFGVNFLENKKVEVFSGENLGKFILKLDKLGINKLNPLFGIPGTIGGAVRGNAGSFGVEIGEFIKKVKIYNFEKQKIEEINYFFDYRSSNLKKMKNIFVVSVILDFDKNIDFDIYKPQFYVKKRLEIQPSGFTCGSYFKNVKVTESFEFVKKVFLEESDEKLLISFVKKGIVPAGWLIDKVGMKGFDFGGVKVSQKHANFLLNYGKVDGKKIYELGNLIKEKVYEKFGILLEEEVVLV